MHWTSKPSIKNTITLEYLALQHTVYLWEKQELKLSHSQYQMNFIHCICYKTIIKYIEQLSLLRVLNIHTQFRVIFFFFFYFVFSRKATRLPPFDIKLQPVVTTHGNTWTKIIYKLNFPHHILAKWEQLPAIIPIGYNCDYSNSRLNPWKIVSYLRGFIIHTS